MLFLPKELWLNQVQRLSLLITQHQSLLLDLNKLGFDLVGYGCTTCIGNSGPLQEPISAGINHADLSAVSVLSGNRNFEGRINPDVKMNYLASPPLVVAYAIAGTMNIDLNNDALGSNEQGKNIYLKDICIAFCEHFGINCTFYCYLNFLG